NRFVMLGSGIIFLSVLAILGLVVLLGGGGSGESVAQSPTVTASPAPTPTPTAPATPPAVAATPVAIAGGLQYVIIRPGSGITAQDGDTVTIGYTEWLQDTGAQVDSTYTGGSLLTFVLGDGTQIKGFDQGI